MLTKDMKRLRNEIDTITDGRARFIKDLTRDRKERRNSVGAMMAGFRDTHSEMAREMRSRLMDESKDRRDTVAAMMADSHTYLTKTAKRMQAQRRDFMAALGDETKRRSDSVAAMMAGFRDTRAEIARETSEELLNFVSGVKDSVGELKEAVANLQQDFAADIAGARQAFFGFGPEAKIASPPVPRAEPQPQEDVPEEVIPDDLTRIRGIGSRLQEHLNDVGIYTFAQLASSTPQYLHQHLGDLSRRANVKGWIEQAKILA